MICDRKIDMTNDYEISVIIPAYNAEKFLHRCLDSVISQTIFDKLQVIVIDDGSTDKTGNIADSYAEKHSNILCIHQKNGGHPKARNVALQQAVGKYVGFVDADDWVDVDFFQKLFEAIERTNSDIAVSGFTVESAAKDILRNHVTKHEKIMNHEQGIIAFLKRDIDVNFWTKLFRREMTKAIQFNTHLRITSDRWFVFDAIMKSNKAVLINGSGYHYCMNKDSIVHTITVEKNLDNLLFIDYMKNRIAKEAPSLMHYAECMEIYIKCRLLGDLSYEKDGKCKALCESLRKDIKNFSLIKASKYSSKKHFVSLIIAKINPKLYALLRSNEYLKYKT